ncbi:hypothetical protein KIW84_023927 [Lathyrus oleraceus]|uniref:DUF7745 domain-containing protein n=1 Tax=Pisum sativum TaxID=3888 RepID=A0A9D4YI17_PEA|nr:hypothetical protein KIW84_023927 [Pisum sativum]
MFIQSERYKSHWGSSKSLFDFVDCLSLHLFCLHIPKDGSYLDHQYDLKRGTPFVVLFLILHLLHGKTKKEYKEYSFRQPDLKELRNLTSYVLDPLGFKDRYGKLLSILTTQVDEGLTSVLVQFYDPLYRCFTFPDFQLLPTLEEYAYLVGIPILDQLPFSGLERVPTSQEIDDMLHIDESLVGAQMTTKGGIQGLPSEFLIAQAIMYGKAMSEDAFEAIFVLLIYGLVLFPNIYKPQF